MSPNTHTRLGDPAVRIVLAVQADDGTVIYQHGYGWVRAQSDRVDIAGWGLSDPLRTDEWRRETTIEWVHGWPHETWTWPAETDWARGELPPATRALPDRPEPS